MPSICRPYENTLLTEWGVLYTGRVGTFHPGGQGPGATSPRPACWWNAPCRTSALDALPAVYETPWLRHVRLDAPLTVCVDGREGRAVIKL